MNGPVLRIVDANANRAREGLRVVEDYARFVLNSDEICGQIKQLRHELVAALSSDAIAWRDTPGDVGTQIKTDAELKRRLVAEGQRAEGRRAEGQRDEG